MVIGWLWSACVQYKTWLINLPLEIDWTWSLFTELHKLSLINVFLGFKLTLFAKYVQMRFRHKASIISCNKNVPFAFNSGWVLKKPIPIAQMKYSVMLSTQLSGVCSSIPQDFGRVIPCRPLSSASSSTEESHPNLFLPHFDSNACQC